MTAAAGVGSRRPTKPRPSLLPPLGIVAFVVITWLATSREFGIGIDVGELFNNLTRVEGLLWRDSADIADRGLLNPNWPFLPETNAPMVETFQMAALASAIGWGPGPPKSVSSWSRGEDHQTGVLLQKWVKRGPETSFRANPGNSF